MSGPIVPKQLAVGFTVTGWAALRRVEPELLFYLGLVRPGVVNTTLQISAAFGIAVISGVFFGIVQGHDAPQAYARAFEGSLSINAILLAACVVPSVRVVRPQQRALRLARESRALNNCA